LILLGNELSLKHEEKRDELCNFWELVELCEVNWEP